MWEWFLPKGDRDLYRSNIMEGPHGGGGDLSDLSVGGRIALFALVIVAIALFAFVIWLVK